MSDAIHEITERIHTLLGQSMKDKEADFVLIALNVMMRDSKDCREFVRLIEKWKVAIHE